MIIYKITNRINGKIYIGQTIRPLSVRLKQHLARGESLVSKAIKKYGIDNFVIEQIDAANSISSLNEKEIYWIKYNDCISPNGYNISQGGFGSLGVQHSESWKKQHSLKMRGVSNPLFGKKHSIETKRKIGLKSKNRAWFHRAIINKDTNEYFSNMKEACEKYSIDASSLSKCCRGKNKTSGGYHWVYA